MSGYYRDVGRIRHHLFDRLGDAVQAQILAEVWRWTPHARAQRDGHTWVVKTDEEFRAEGVTASARAIRGAIMALDEQGFLIRTRGPHPNGRAPNARYLRIEAELFDELEAVAQSGRARHVAEKFKAESAAGSTRPPSPSQSGNSRRFHVQETDNKTANKTTIIREKRAGSKEGKSKEGKSLELSSNLRAIQAAFDEGCQMRHSPHRAPVADAPNRIRGLQRFADACATLGRTNDAEKIARHFGKHYDVWSAARELGKETDAVSPAPNQMLLGMLAAYAVSSWEDAEANAKKFAAWSNDGDEDA